MEKIYSQTEKDYLEKLNSFREELEEKLGPNSKIDELEYYNKVNVGENLTINIDTYVSTICDDDGKKRIGIFAKNSNGLLGYVDEQGNIEFVDSLLKSANINLTFDDFKNLNYQNLCAKVEQSKSDELEKNLKTSQTIKDDIEEKPGKKLEENKDEIKNEKVEEDLTDSLGEDLDITYYRKIEDDQINEEFKNELEGANEIGIAYSKKLNAFICVINDGTKFKKADGIEIARPTMQTVISIDERGEKTEKKSPHALMKTKDGDKELSITIGQYGYIEAGIVKRLPCNERIEYQIREQGEGEKGRQNVETRKFFNKDGKEAIHNLAHQYNENEQNGFQEQRLEDIDPDSTIELEDGSLTTLEDEAARAKVTVEEFRRIYLESEGKNADEKLKNAHETIEEQFLGPQDVNR